jgi:branched-subunit amino acid aminotransferase/4-amino-4-deoxychorismate lyase
MSQILYQFSEGRFSPIEWCDPSRATTLVADSFRLEDGLVVAFERHLERFSASVAAHTDAAPERLEAFLTALPAALPTEGSWFPRIEAVDTPGGATLRYRQRPAPAWESEVVIARAASDPRRHPHRKGPDLDALMALRTEVAALGAQEAIITTDEDRVVEGAYSSLMIWLPGDDGPTVIPPATPHLPGVTEAILQGIAVQQGVEIHEKDLTVSELEGAEVWILSALHGIRMASAFVGGPQLTQSPGRRDTWQRAWRSLATPVRAQASE